MAHYKQYNEQSHPNNELIKMAKKKGLTNVVITWHGAMAYHRHLIGWNLSCDQVPHNKFYDRTKLVEFIKQYNPEP